MGLSLIVLGGILFSTTRAQAGQVFDLAANWSDSGNPNGPWSYNIALGAPLIDHLADNHPTHHIFASTQPAYAPGIVTATACNNPGHIASFLTSVSTSNNGQDDFPSGHVYMHGDDPYNSPTAYEYSIVGITWTSPTGGTATISGGLWEAPNLALQRTRPAAARPDNSE
jgi:hypothetical protein